jgi:bifunctional DNA-binding transcriptional regulator/antitoxin component of YhaV-PrlF toxin-antitoxin module
VSLEILTIGPAGQIELPDEVRDRYGMAPATPVRIVETRGGVLLVPLSDVPMSPELAEELAQWQALGAQTWEIFPFDDESESS